MKNGAMIACVAWMLVGILPAHASLSFLPSTQALIADFSSSNSGGIQSPLDFSATARALQFGSFGNEFQFASIPAPEVQRQKEALDELAEGLQEYVDRLPRSFFVLWIMCLESQSERNEQVSSVTSQWTKADPSAALIWIQEMQTGDEREYLREASGERGDRLSARWASSIERSESRERQIDFITSSWATLDLSSDSNWVTPIPEPQTSALTLGLFTFFWITLWRARNSSNRL